MVWESHFRKWQRIVLIILLIVANYILMSDWIIFGPLFILLLHIFRDRPMARLIAFTATAAVWMFLLIFTGGCVWIGGFINFGVVMLAYFCMTTFYNGRKGKHPVFAKWFFYAFYPLHYIIIWLIFRLTQ